MINVYQPSLGREELERIGEVFDSNWVGKGQLVDDFEERFANHIGAEKEQVLSTNCCTEGLFSSMHLLDIRPQDEVIVPAVSFVGAANAVCENGSRLVLCDTDPRTLNVRAQDIEKVITPDSKAVLLLHYGGIPCEMDEIMNLAEEHHLKVIEDCAAGVCSSYKGQALGTIGDMGTLIVISVLDRQAGIGGMLKNWLIVYLGNAAGSILAAAGCVYGGQLNYSGGELAVFTMRLAAGKCSLGTGSAVILGVLCNVLVTTGVLLALSAKDLPGRVNVK